MAEIADSVNKSSFEIVLKIGALYCLYNLKLFEKFHLKRCAFQNQSKDIKCKRV